MIEIYGRTDSSAVARLMWTVHELGLPHRLIARGGEYGGLDEAEYRAINPAGTIPGVRLEDGRTLWESNAIIRFLAERHDRGGLSPADPVARAQAEAWMDWSFAFARVVGAIRKAYKMPGATPESCAPAVADAGRVIVILETALAQGSGFIAGDRLTIADLSMGVIAHRLMRCPAELAMPRFEAIADWYARLCEREAYQTAVVSAVSAGPQPIGGNAI